MPAGPGVTQSELGHGLAPGEAPRVSVDSEGVRSEGETAASATDMATLVEPSFDENILRTLCATDCGTQLLLDRIKQSTVSCRVRSPSFSTLVRTLAAPRC